MSLHCGSYSAQRAGGGGPVTLRLERPHDSSVVLTLSDENDPCFLSILNVTRDDYSEIKKVQGLLVDFDNFPAQFVRLLQQCECGNMFLSLHREGPLNVVLEIVERNEFKRLVHLSLKTALASDSEIKKNMAENIIILKKDISTIRSTLLSKEAAFMEKENFLEMRINDLSTCLNRMNSEKQQQENEHHDVLKQERNRIEQEKSDWKKSTELNLKTQLNTMQETLLHKDKQIEDMNCRCRQFQDTIKSLESQIKDKGKRIFSLEKQLHTVRMDAESWRNQNGVLDRDYHDKEQNLMQTRNRLMDAEKALKEKSDMLRDTLDSMQSLQREKIALEDRVKHSETMATKRHAEIQTNNEQLTKANQIISKQHADILELREKLMCRTAIALEQEKVINKNADVILKHQQKENDLFADLDEKRKAYNQLQDEYEDVKRAIEEKAEIIKTNNTTIQWLHKKIDALESVNNLATMSSHRSNSAPFTTRPAMDRDCGAGDNDNRLSNLYTAGLRGDDLISCRSGKTTSENMARSSSPASDEQYSVDPVYLKPSSYSSARTSTRSKSQDTSGKRSYAQLPDHFKGVNKQNSADTVRTSRNSSDRLKKNGGEGRFVTSKMSAYFPKP